MNNVNLISEEQFLKVYNQYKPNKFTTFVYDHFSTNAKPNKKWINKLITFLLVVLFWFGFTVTIVKTDHYMQKDIADKTILVSSVILLSIMFCLSVLFFIAVLMNNRRINKIRKSLNITKSEYQILANMYVG